ncbi:hypothetical protein cypCar_00031180 [Cyprinus carpio]|nr:hypothetical protein cypCar_00031180 [Cyprinus carpio]
MPSADPAERTNGSEDVNKDVGDVSDETDQGVRTRLSAERELHAQRLCWLRAESVHRVLREIVQENRFSKASSALTAEDKELLEMKQRLPSELLQHLKKKAVSILTYYQPEWENESEGLRSVKLSKLPELLDAERKRAKSLAEKNRENDVLLQRQTHAYLSELLKCMNILQRLVLDLRLKAQKDLDRKKIEYFEAKCEIGLQKIRAEMLEVQLDTYTRDKIAAHKKITEKLRAELKSSELDKQALESKLTSFQIYGQDFEALAEEYSRLRQEIATKSWALKEFST